MFKRFSDSSLPEAPGPAMMPLQAIHTAAAPHAHQMKGRGQNTGVIILNIRAAGFALRGGKMRCARCGLALDDERRFAMPRLVLLSGPSCVGKSPLARALHAFRPDLAERLVTPVLYNCRAPRPGERDGVDYHFRSREFLEGLRARDGYLVMDVRNDVQALALSDLQAILDADRDAFFEGNPYIACALLDSPLLATFPKLSVFVAPVSGEEVAYLQAQGEGVAARVVCDVMRRKLLRRTARQKGSLSFPDLQDIEARCGAAWRELSYAWRFDWVLPNHDGEDSENWDAFYWPLGDARRCLLDFAALLEGGVPVRGEKWTADLIACS